MTSSHNESSGGGGVAASLSFSNWCLVFFLLFFSLLASYILSASYVIWRHEGIWRLPFGASAFKSLLSAIKSVRFPYLSPSSSRTTLYRDLEEVTVAVDMDVMLAEEEAYQQPPQVSDKRPGIHGSHSQLVKNLALGKLWGDDPQLQHQHLHQPAGGSPRPNAKALSNNSPHEETREDTDADAEKKEELEHARVVLHNVQGQEVGAGTGRKRRLSYNSSFARLKRSLQAAQYFINPRNFWESNNHSSSNTSGARESGESNQNPYHNAYSMPSVASSSTSLYSKDFSRSTSSQQLAKSWDGGVRSLLPISYATFSRTTEDLDVV
jgi:hypothetical protein